MTQSEEVGDVQAGSSGITILCNPSTKHRWAKTGNKLADLAGRPAVEKLQIFDPIERLISHDLFVGSRLSGKTTSGPSMHRDLSIDQRAYILQNRGAMEELNGDRDGRAKGGVPSDLLLPLVYEELRRLAARKMAAEPAGQTLQATALVHEAWVRVGGEGQSWENRAHFFGAAAEAMRRILIEAARRKKTKRHGGGLERVDAEVVPIVAPLPDEKLLELHEALDLLADHDGRKAELVKLRYFAGLSIEEAAEVLGISAPTAKRDWAYARAWMVKKLKGKAHSETPRGSPISGPAPM